MNKNLYIVESPLQLLSAIEACAHFKKYSILLIKYSNHKTNDIQLSKLKKFIKHNEIIEIKSGIGNFYADINLLKLLKNYKNEGIKFDKIFIGEYRSYHMRNFFDILNPNDCYILDDGSISLIVYEHILANKDMFYFSKLKGRIKSVIYKLEELYFGFIFHKVRRDIYMFTCFDILFNDNVKNIKHSFENLKKTFTYQKKHIVYFYGSSLEEFGFSQEILLSYMQFIEDYYRKKNLEIIYLPHRKETKKKLLYFKNKLNLKIKYSEFPAEIQLMIDCVVPTHIASFCSSILVTLPSIYDIKNIEAFCFSIDKMPLNLQQEWYSTRNAYENIMKVTEL